MSEPEWAKNLGHFTGTETWFQHALMKHITFTEGVKYLADNAGSYWLIDEIASYQLIERIKKEKFQVWKLEVVNNTGTLSCTDGNDNPVFAKHMSFTDFPLSEITLWFTNNVIMLPSEY